MTSIPKLSMNKKALFLVDMDLENSNASTAPDFTERTQTGEMSTVETTPIPLSVVADPVVGAEVGLFTLSEIV